MAANVARQAAAATAVATTFMALLSEGDSLPAEQRAGPRVDGELEPLVARLGAFDDDPSYVRCRCERCVLDEGVSVSLEQEHRAAEARRALLDPGEDAREPGRRL